MENDIPGPSPAPSSSASRLTPLGSESNLARYAPAPASAFSFSPELIIQALFKHKWTILICAALGVGAASVAYKLIRPVYSSEAKLWIKYIRDAKLPTDLEEQQGSRKMETRTDSSVILTEIEILTSMDLAEEVAKKVGPERILGNPAAAEAVKPAAEALHNALHVDLTSKYGAVIRVEYIHPDPTVAQDVVNAVIEQYQTNHKIVHGAPNQAAEAITREMDELRASLTQAEEELRKLVERAGTSSIPDARAILRNQMASLQNSIMTTEASLAESRAVLQSRESTPAPEAPTDAPATPTSEVPPEKLTEYRLAVATLASLQQRRREYALTYADGSLPVAGVVSQITKTQATINQLETQYPTLRSSVSVPVADSVDRMIAPDGPSDASNIVRLEARLSTLRQQMADVRSDLASLTELEPLITDLQRTIDLKEQRYRNYVRNREQREIESRLTPLDTNILDIQSPTAATQVPGKRLAISAGLAVGGIGLGIAWAILAELFLNRSVRRANEVQDTLGLPLFFSIPRIVGLQRPQAAAGKALGEGSAANRYLPSPTEPKTAGASSERSSAIAPPPRGLRSLVDALRDRLVFYFEVRNFTRKPKLIALSSCGNRAGVSTIASGLAASLSESGDGNVLLVDMNPGSPSPAHFHKGELKCDLDDALEQQKRDGALVQSNLYVVSHSSGDDKLSSILPKRFTKLVPKLKTSDYDYIIFDLPPVDQISATPQLARYMDMLLLVVEAEKNSRDTVKRVGSMFADAGVNFGVVLNKTRNYVPEKLRAMLATES